MLFRGWYHDIFVECEELLEQLTSDVQRILLEDPRGVVGRGSQPRLVQASFRSDPMSARYNPVKWRKVK